MIGSASGPAVAQRKKRPLLVTFSGVDGSGKSTQISNLCSLIQSWGLTLELRTFWENAVVLTRYRERFVQSVLKSESGVGSPERPVARKDKNVRGWHLDLVRRGLYALDAVSVRNVISRASRSDTDVVVMDRYIYDELANLPLDSKFSRAYVKAIAKLVPRPDIAFVLDADPVAARQRKPEYPIEFIEQNRLAYLKLSALLGNLTVVPATGLREAKQLVELSFARIHEIRTQGSNSKSRVCAA